MKLSVLIPWRSDDPWRIAAWNYLRPLWARTDVELCVADDGRTEGTFSVARAINRARRQATGDALAIFGADHVPPEPDRVEWIRDRLRQHPWTAVYAATRAINQAGTTRLLNHEITIDLASVARFDWVACCYGIVAMRADVFDDIGGYDERFEGWGPEDMALLSTLKALYPDGNPNGEGEAIALWHADAPRDRAGRNVDLHNEYITAAGQGRMRQYLREVRGDEPGNPG